MTEDAKILGRGRYLRLLARAGWEFVERTRGSGVVGIIAVTQDEDIVLVEQYREPFQKPSVELPAGLVGDAGLEDPLTAAMRELEEETGYTAVRWEFLFSGGSSTGLTTETIAMFLATSLQRSSEGGGDDSEDIIVHVIPLDELDEWLAFKASKGCIIDIKLHMALPIARAALVDAKRRLQDQD